MTATGTMPEIKETKAAAGNVWVLRGLVALGAVLMLVAWFLPWWNIDIEGFGHNMIQIRPWGLAVSENMGGFAILLKGAEMPSFFAPMMWAYLVLCMLALSVGALVRGKEFHFGKFNLSLAQILIGGVGFSYIVAGIVAAIYASIRMRTMADIPLQGRAFIDMGDPLIAFVDTSLQLGWYLTFVTGLFLLAIALLYYKITGEKPANS